MWYNVKSEDKQGVGYSHPKKKKEKLHVLHQKAHERRNETEDPL